MDSLPHHYHVTAAAGAEGTIAVSSPGLEVLTSAPPAEFGGPGDLWSPETFLVAAVVDCFILTFRAVARASSLAWVAIECEGDGTLDRVERTTRFTGVKLRARLTIPKGTDLEKAERLLHKAEQNCLITNSLSCPVELSADLQQA